MKDNLHIVTARVEESHRSNLL